MTQRIADDDRLVARLLDEAGIHPAASSVAHADVVAIVARAVDIGRRRANGQVARVRSCRICGCSDLMPCRPEPCAWAEPDLCTACAAFPESPP